MTNRANIDESSFGVFKPLFITSTPPFWDNENLDSISWEDGTKIQVVNK
jgi:hypothetical protein